MEIIIIIKKIRQDADMVTERNFISYEGCMTQLYFFLVFVISECHMLAAMAYDRYVAICNPLLYNVTMSYQVCSWLVGGVYIMGLTGATAHTGCMLRVLFCKADRINHYFCDLLSHYSPSPLAHSIPATLALLLFLEHSRCVPCLGLYTHCFFYSVMISFLISSKKSPSFFEDIPDHLTIPKISILCSCFIFL